MFIRSCTVVVVGVFAIGPGFGQPIDDLPKAAKPKPQLPAVADPAKAAEDPDFGIQGEYTGVLRTPSGPVKIGVQLVAQGGGKFAYREFVGGLPGDGWDGKPTTLTPLTGTQVGSKVIYECKPGQPCLEVSGSLLTSADPRIESLQRIERTSPTLGAKPPEGAVVLFGSPGDEKTNWVNGKLIELSDGTYLAAGAMSKHLIGAVKAHVEFRTPWMPNNRGQQRGNSGVYIQQRYEIQVLDSFGLDGKPNECGALYTQTAPSVNMCLPPLVWQTYDIDFTPAQFDANGQKTANARMTLLHNGVLIHDSVELPKQTGHGKKEEPTSGPITLQDHRTPVVYRNVWLVEKK